MTDGLIDDVTEYAVRRARWIERQTGRHDPPLACELMQDALGDTYAGIVTWDSTQAPLALHLKSVIRSRVSHDLARLQQFPEFPLDHVSEELERDLSSAMEATATPDESMDLDVYVDETIATLRALADDDAPVLQLLDAYAKRAIERSEVMHATGMSSATYHNAHRRMLRLVRRLRDREEAQTSPQLLPCRRASRRLCVSAHGARDNSPAHHTTHRGGSAKCMVRRMHDCSPTQRSRA